MCHDLHSPGHSYLRAWACRWSQSLQVQDIQQKYIWTQPRSTRRRGENQFHHLNQCPGCTFPHSQNFQGPIKLYIWKQTNTHSQKSVFHVAVRGLRYRVYTCWVGGPTQTSAWPQLPFPLFCSFARSSPQVQTPATPGTRENTCKQTSDWICSRRTEEVKSHLLFSAEFEWSSWEKRINWPGCSRTSWGGWDCGSPSLWPGTENLRLWICRSRPDSDTEGSGSFC